MASTLHVFTWLVPYPLRGLVGPSALFHKHMEIQSVAGWDFYHITYAFSAKVICLACQYSLGAFALKGPALYRGWRPLPTPPGKSAAYQSWAPSSSTKGPDAEGKAQPSTTASHLTFNLIQRRDIINAGCPWLRIPPVQFQIQTTFICIGACLQPSPFTIHVWPVHSNLSIYPTSQASKAHLTTTGPRSPLPIDARFQSPPPVPSYVVFGFSSDILSARVAARRRWWIARRTPPRGSLPSM